MRNTHLGIIGGGQLGLLLLQSAVQFPIHVSVYDKNSLCSAAPFTQNFVEGPFDDVDKIVEFGSACDIIVYETEKVSVEALKKLEEMGKTVLSAWHSLEWIQDKAVQRKKLAEAGFPVPEFQEVEASQVRQYSGSIPVVQKINRGGYDGQGVIIHEDTESLQNAPEYDSLFEQKVDIKMEIGGLLARDADGNIVVYPAIEMVFDPEANLVDHLIAPARISPEISDKVKGLCHQIAEKFDFRGIYAIEFFLDQNDKLLVNEISPRPHNSGHHTVSANVTSQYEQQIRIALGLPLGSVEQISPCVLLNLLADNSTGDTNYVGLDKAYEIPNVQYVLYGKSTVRPKRKMGHALILEGDIDTALSKMEKIRNTLTITSHEQ